VLGHRLNLLVSRRRRGHHHALSLHPPRSCVTGLIDVAEGVFEWPSRR
jgi:hypothetical protein